MKKTLRFAPIVIIGVFAGLLAGVDRAAAQGPAGAGAANAAHDNPVTFNPIHWVKKDSNDSVKAAENRSDLEKKLTSRLQAQSLLAADANATEVCAPFTALDGCLAALHASHNLGVDFVCLRAVVTGVHTSASMAGCKAADGEKAQSLSKAIHQLKPDANGKQATKEAEQQAKDDLKGIGG